VLSDQGLVVEFETPVEDLASTEADKVVDRVEGNEIIEQALNVVEAELQALQIEMRTQIREAFWQSYYSMCQTLAGYLEILKGLILAHPTVTMRMIMRNAYIYAQAGLDSIDVCLLPVE